MNVERAIVYVFDDPEWLKKVGIGGVLLLVPIFGWLVVVGYGLRLIRRTYLGEDRLLPEWDDFGGDAVRGLKAVVALVVWSIPLWIAQFGFFCLIFPFVLLGESDTATFSVLFSVLAGIGGIVISVVSVALQLLYGLVLPLFLSRVAVTDRLESAFDFNEIINEVRLIPGPLVVVALLQVAISYVVSFGVILCVIGVLFTSFLGYAVLAHLIGQVRRQIDLRNVLAPEPVAGT